MSIELVADGSALDIPDFGEGRVFIERDHWGSQKHWKINQVACSLELISRLEC